MTNIYINTYEQLTISNIETGEIDNCYKNGKTIITSFRVIREATKEEYLKWIEDLKLSYMITQNIHDKDLKFYYIEVLD